MKTINDYINEASKMDHFSKSKNKNGSSGWHQYTEDIWNGNPWDKSDKITTIKDFYGPGQDYTHTEKGITLIDFGKAALADKNIGASTIAEELVDYWDGLDELPTTDQFNNVCIYLQELGDKKLMDEFFEQFNERILGNLLKKAKGKKLFNV